MDGDPDLLTDYTCMTVCAKGEFPGRPKSWDHATVLNFWRPYPPRRENAPLYEAEGKVPLFWLCLFDPRHLHKVTVYEDGDGGYEYDVYDDIPALLAPHAEAIANAVRRRPLLEKLLSPRELNLYDAFAKRVREEFAPFVLVATYEVAKWREYHEEYFKEVAEALQTLEVVAPETWTTNSSFASVTGLDPAGTATSLSNWSTLVGYDYTSDWPDEPERENDLGHSLAEISPPTSANHGWMALALSWITNKMRRFSQ